MIINELDIVAMAGGDRRWEWSTHIGMYEFKWLCSALGLDFDDLPLVLGLDAVHVELSFVYPSMRDCRAVG